MRVRAAVDDLPLGELGRRLGLGERATVDGSVSARAPGRGAAGPPEGAARDASSSTRSRLVVAGETLTSQEPVVASFDASALRVERLLARGTAGTISGRGTLRTRGAPRCASSGPDPAGRARVAPARGGSGQRDPGRDGDGARHDLGARDQRRRSPRRRERHGPRLRGARHARSTHGSPRRLPACVWSRPGRPRRRDRDRERGGGAGGQGARSLPRRSRLSVAATPLDGLSTLWDGDLSWRAAPRAAAPR